MKAIIRQEMKNYLRNPILWLGLIFIFFQLYQILTPYLYIARFQSGQELEEIEPGNTLDADITEGYVPSTQEERMNQTCEQIKGDFASHLGIPQQEANDILDEMRQKNMSIDEMEAEMAEKYEFYGKYGIKYYYNRAELRKGNLQEINSYVEQNLKAHSFSYYFALKFADFAGLFMGFFATILLAFLFIRDTKKDTYELLHTKPISALQYVCGKIGGGFLMMLTVLAIMIAVFGGMCEYYGRSAGFPVSTFEFLRTAILYIVPNMLMITCIYAAIALIFKNPLPAVPFMFLYLIYSNMGSIGPDGNYGYFGRPLAIMVRFPGRFFEAAPLPMATVNQICLIIGSVLLTALAAGIWKRRRVY